MKEVLVERSWSDVILPADQAAKLVEIFSKGVTVESANARRAEVPYSKYAESVSVHYRGATPKLTIGPLHEDLRETREEAQAEADALLEKRVEERTREHAEKERLEREEAERAKFEQECAAARDHADAEAGGEQGLDDALAGRTTLLVTGDPFADETPASAFTDGKLMRLAPED